MQDDALLSEQIDYYRARAVEYDEWFFRTGRYDRGVQHREEWLREAALAESELRRGLPPGDVLEFACGTGLWTRHLAECHRRVLAVDASPESIALNRARLNSERVTYVAADIFAWTPPAAAFDAVFFGFWLSHVPEARFDQFWEKVRAALRPGGAAFFVDSLLEPASTARDHAPLDESGIVRRRLNDGREFSVVKVFHEPGTLSDRLIQLGWSGSIKSTGRFFLYGLVRPINV